MSPIALALAVLTALLPVPSDSNLQSAESDIQEVYGEQLTSARNAPSCAALADELLDVAASSKPANRYALLIHARDLAVAANDSARGLRAAEGLAEFEGATDAAEGHRLWGAAKGKDELLEKLKAAEVYLRGLEAGKLGGLNKVAAEGRLRELESSASNLDGRILSPAELTDLFSIPGAVVDGDTVQWADRQGGGIWSQPFANKQPIRFGFEIRACQRHAIRVKIDSTGYVFSVGHYDNAYTIVATDAGGEFRKIRVSNCRVDSPDKWHSLAAHVGDGKVSFYYDKRLAYETKQEPTVKSQSPVRVGFGDHQTQVSLRRAYLALGD